MQATHRPGCLDASIASIRAATIRKLSRITRAALVSSRTEPMSSRTIMSLRPMMRSRLRGKLAPAAKPLLAIIALCVCALPLAGCGGDRAIAEATTPPDYRVRHPIIIGEADYSLDLFPTGAGDRLDPRSADRLRDFAKRYREVGHGQVTVLVPTGGPYDPAVSASLAHIRVL